MPDLTLLAVFIPTFFLVSVTPGMCMTLAMTLGMSIGVRKTLWMMVGELIGVAIVAIAAVMGVASIMLNYPNVFTAFKFAGAAYLIYLGIKQWRAKTKLTLDEQQTILTKRSNLFNQGLITALANPKGWAFMVTLLPPFINVEQNLTIQMIGLLTIILLSEFSCMLLYATGGKSLRIVLNRNDNMKWLNRIAGGLLIIVGFWLAMS
ncbi:LysE family translocator [Shewanella marina]|uniref:LysE family translocator n=1 Tax=Shewanella marina TaxID=487319 RepID=UPI000472ADBA|nr:LysE family translocator [Shewanella marina]